MVDQALLSKIEDLQKLTFDCSDYKPAMVPAFQSVKEQLLGILADETGIDNEDFLAVPITNKMLNKDRCLFFLNCFVKLAEGSASFIIKKSAGVCHDSDNSDKMEKLQTENQMLKDEAIADKKVIIDLQEKVIVQTEKKLHDVQNTVKSEMKSFSSIVKDTCAAALAPSKIETAIKNAKLDDTSTRNHNIIVYGVPDEAEEDISRTVLDVFEEVGERPRLISCCRLGTKREVQGSIRPIKCCLSSVAFVTQILRNAPRLKQSDRFGAVYLSPDRTTEERTKRRQLVDQLKIKKRDNPDVNYRIDFTNNIIVVSTA